MIFMMDFLKTAKELLVECKLKQASEISTFKGGGSAYVFLPQNTCETIKTIAFLKRENIPFNIIGGGSNILISDGICKSVLISLKHIDSIFFDSNCLHCGGGASIANIVKEGQKYSLGGLEFLFGVPCTIGGAIKMNAGAFSSQMADYLHSIDILTLDNAICDKIPLNSISSNYQDLIKTVSAQNQEMSYRHGVDKIALGATLKLVPMQRDKSIEKIKEFAKLRKEKQPHQPSLGCVFKNGRIPSGKLIEECGLKGYKIGGAMISDIHANFIVNIKDATAKDYLNLTNLAKQRVFEKFGITLEEEFCLIT